ncbi:MAG: SHOCT domain-containing protein [Actinomycetota bacterium]
MWMILFWIGFVFLIIWGVRQISGRSRSGSDRRAIEILEERFARDEIDRDEFEERRRALEER